MIKRFFVAISLLVIVLACNLALLNPSFFRVHDYTHAARISEMSRALADGHFPVRWSENFGFGYGMPLFNFYAPLPYYVGAAIFLSGFDIIISIKMLYVVSSILVVIGAYKLARMYSGHSGAILAAAVVALAPYRALNLYIRGALSEAWALAFLPFIIWSLVLIIRGKTQYWWLFAISLAALALSHNISLVISTPIIGLFGIAELYRQHRFNLQKMLPTLGTLIGSGLLAFSLAAFYLIPAFAEKNATKVEEYILDGYFNYHLHFLYIRQFFQHQWQYGGSGWGPQDDISFGLGIGQLIALGFTAFIAIVMLAKKLPKAIKHRTISLSQNWWLICAVGGLLAFSLLMTTEKSVFIWERIQLLEYVQFPWRWLTVAIPLMGVLAALGSNCIRPTLLRWSYVLLICIVIVSINTRYFFPEKYLADPNEIYQTTPESVLAGMSNILPDYIPKQMPKSIASATDIVTNRSELGEIQVLSDKTHAKLIKLVVPSEREVIWTVSDFPGWQIEVDGQVVEKKVSPLGLLKTTVPAGEHTVGVVLKLTPIQYWSQLVSILGLLGVCIGIGFKPATRTSAHE